MIAACSGVSVPLTPKRGFPGFTLGRFLTFGLSLPLAEILAAGSLHLGPLMVHWNFQPPAEVFLIGISLDGSPSSFLGP
jgi:hypothetical protein